MPSCRLKIGNYIYEALETCMERVPKQGICIENLNVSDVIISWMAWVKGVQEGPPLTIGNSTCPMAMLCKSLSLSLSLTLSLKKDTLKVMWALCNETLSVPSHIKKRKGLSMVFHQCAMSFHHHSSVSMWIWVWGNLIPIFIGGP